MLSVAQLFRPMCPEESTRRHSADASRDGGAVLRCWTAEGIFGQNLHADRRTYVGHDPVIDFAEHLLLPAGLAQRITAGGDIETS